jgi:hypothetical protein
MTTDLLTIDPWMLAIGVVVAGCAFFSARPWHKPEEWREAPLEIRAFLWFSLVAVFAEFVVLGALSDLRDSWNPYLGRGPIFVYVIGATASMTLCRTRANRVRWVLIGVLALWAVISLGRFASHHQRTVETDPDRMVSPYQLIWMVGVPLVWMLVLLSPRVKLYCARMDVVTT